MMGIAMVLRNLGLIIFTWFATVGFGLITGFILHGNRGPEGQPQTVGITWPFSLVEPIIFGAWAYGIASLSPIFFVGPNAKSAAWWAILPVPIWIFFINGGFFPINYQSWPWVLGIALSAG